MSNRKFFRLFISLAILLMRTFIPSNVSLIGYAPAQYGWLLQEPLVISSLASEWHDEAGTSVDGRHLKHTGETQATSVPKRQDTFLSGTAGTHGLCIHEPFQDRGATTTTSPPITRTAWVSLMAVPPPVPLPSTKSCPPAALDTTRNTAEIWMEWGNPPVSTDGSDYSHDSSKRYTYLHLAYQSPDNQDYRIRFEYGQSIALDVTYNAGANWDMGVAVLKDLGNFEKYLQQNNNQITIKVIPSLGYQTLGVEIGNGHMLYAHARQIAEFSRPKTSLLSPIVRPRCPRTAKSGLYTGTAFSNLPIFQGASRPSLFPSRPLTWAANSKTLPARSCNSTG